MALLKYTPPIFCPAGVNNRLWSYLAKINRLDKVRKYYLINKFSDTWIMMLFMHAWRKVSGVPQWITYHTLAHQ